MSKRASATSRRNSIASFYLGTATASLRAKTIDNELTTIGIALKNGMIGTDTAVAWVRDCGMLWFVGAP